MKSCVLFCPSTTWGGVEKNVLVRARFLSKRKYKVFVIILNGYFANKFTDIPNVTVINVKNRGGDFNLFVIYNYVRILTKIKPNTVFSALKKDWFLVSLASRIAKVPNIILYLGIKRKIKTNIKYKFVFKYLKPILTVNSDSLKEHLMNTSPYFNSKNLIRIYNGFPPVKTNSEKINFITQFNLSPDSIIIGCAGRFSKQKGFDLIPEILTKLPDNIHIVHAGSQGDYETEIKKIIDNSNIKNRVHYIGNQKDMSSFYNSIHLFLLCSRFEGMANVLNEALNHGVPCVSTKVDGSIELLKNGQFGILTDIEDTEAMATGINNIINKTIIFNPQLSKEYIQKEFSLDIMANTTEKLFFETL